MKRIVTATLAAFLFIAPVWAATQTSTLKVPGMTCTTCPITVKKALQKVEGVSNIEVNYPQKEVVVTFDDAKTSEGLDKGDSKCRLSLAGCQGLKVGAV